MKNKKDIVMKIRVSKKLYKLIKKKSEDNLTTMTDIIRLSILKGLK